MFLCLCQGARFLWFSSWFQQWICSQRGTQLGVGQRYKKSRVVIISDCTIQSISKLTPNQAATVCFRCLPPLANELTLLLRNPTTSKERGVSLVFSRLQGFLWSAWWDSIMSLKAAVQQVWSVSVVGNEGLLPTEWTEVSARESCVFQPNTQWSFPTYPTSWPLTGARRVGMLWVSLESHVQEKSFCVFQAFFFFFFLSNFTRILI